MDVYELAWNALKLHLGHENPLKSAELARILGNAADSRTGTPETRALITELIRRGLPIGATSDGYFVLRTSEELQRYVAELNDRASAILYRAKLVERAFQTYGAGEEHRAYVHWIPEPEEIP